MPSSKAVPVRFVINFSSDLNRPGSGSLFLDDDGPAPTSPDVRKDWPGGAVLSSSPRFESRVFYTSVRVAPPMVDGLGLILIFNARYFRFTFTFLGASWSAKVKVGVSFVSDAFRWATNLRLRSVLC